MDTQPLGGVALLAAVVTASVLGPQRLGRMRRCLTGRLGRLRPAVVPVRPRRPIELIARDAQRLGLGFRHVQEGGVSFAQFEGRRRAYDLVLAEACASLSVEHLLAVLPPGVELDAERWRVERVLEHVGFRLDDAA
jgi:hypothetical protein